MKVNILKVLFVLLTAWASLIQPGHCQSIYDKVHQKVDLPAGGKIVQHPGNKNESIYVVSQETLSTDGVIRLTRPALYRSLDNGNTWQLLTYQFKIKDLLIHPDTNRFFAIADFTIPATDRNGYLTVQYTSKIITSVDGKNWKDLTGKQQYFADLSKIVADPDRPGRIIVYGRGWSGFRLLPVDDTYTDWNREGTDGVSVGF